MNIKSISLKAFNDAVPYDWDKANWELYAVLLAWEKNSYPNAPVELSARINLRNN